MTKIKILKYKRRRKAETNYRDRLALLKSKKLRVVIRKSNRYINVQMIKYSPKGDLVLSTTNSKELIKFGWKASTHNLPAAYLTGLLAGIKTKKEKIYEGVLDIGLYKSIKGNLIYSCLKGLIDSSFKVPYSKEILPNEKRIIGEHIVNQKDLPKHFEEVKQKILQNA